MGISFLEGSSSSSLDAWPSTLQFLQNLITKDASSYPSISSRGADLLLELFKVLEGDESARIGAESSYNYAPPSSSSSYFSFWDSKPPSTNYLRRLSGRNDVASPSERNFVLDITMVFVTVLCAGFASGLTQGLLSLDFTEMTIKSRSGTPTEKGYASKVIPVISRHHLLLVTLMLWNASATEALPIFLAGLVPEYLAIVISVTLVLFVGEIIPAAILTGEIHDLVLVSQTLKQVVLFWRDFVHLLHFFLMYLYVMYALSSTSTLIW